MTPSYQDSRVAVYDNFLAADDWTAVLRYLDKAKFRRILPDAWGSAYQLTNGEPLVGAEVFSSPVDGVPTAHCYPTHTGLDGLVNRILSFKAKIAPLIEPGGVAWSHFTMCPYVYPVDAGLGWHTDSHAQGAYIYYAHPFWGRQWGGELLVHWSDVDFSTDSSISSRGIFRNETIESALACGLGHYITPTPNRIVFLRARTLHMIKRVDSAAGDNARISLAGFFVPPGAPISH